MATRMQQRRGTAADWSAANPVLADGEIGFETDTKIFKIGDGVTPWNALGTSNIVRSVSAAAVGFIVQGVAGQTGNLEEWQDNTGAVRSKIAADGSFTATGTGVSLRVAPNDVQFNRAGARSYITQLGIAGTINLLGSQAVAGDTAMGQFDPVNGVTIGDIGGATLPLPAGATRLKLKAAAGQTADVQQWLDSASAVMARVGPTGLLEARQGLQSTSPVAGAIPLTVKGFAGQTADLQQWVDSTGANLVRVGPSGLLEAKQGLQSTSLAVGNTPLTVKAFAGQTADLVRIIDDTGALLSRFSSGGSLISVATGGHQLGVGAQTSARLNVAAAGGGGTVGISVLGHATQSADLQQWLNNAGTVLAKVTAAGVISGTDLQVAGNSVGVGLIKRAVATANGSQSQTAIAAGTFTTAVTTVSTDGAAGVAGSNVGLTFPAVAGHTYRIALESGGAFSNVAGDGIASQLLMTANPGGTVEGTFVQAAQQVAAGVPPSQAQVLMYTCTTSGNATVVLQLRRNSGTGNVNVVGSTMIAVYDV